MPCIPLTKEEAQALWALAQEQDEARRRLMPDERTAINLFTDAFHRLKKFGWNDAIYCPKDGTVFEIIEPGSSGIHRCHYQGEWPKGSWWVHCDDGDLAPSRPALFRLINERDTTGVP